MREKTEFAVVTGMMPSGKMHIGHKMIVDQLIWYQKQGADIYIPIADMESYSARNIEFDESRELAITEYLTNYIALGLDFNQKNINVYLQSENKLVQNLAYMLGRKVNLNEMKAIYGFTGSTNISHLYLPLIQVADILHPQLEEFGGPKPTVVPFVRIGTLISVLQGICQNDSKTDLNLLHLLQLITDLLQDKQEIKCPAANQKQRYS